MATAPTTYKDRSELSFRDVADGTADAHSYDGAGLLTKTAHRRVITSRELGMNANGTTDNYAILAAALTDCAGYGYDIEIEPVDTNVAGAGYLVETGLTVPAGVAVRGMMGGRFESRILAPQMGAGVFLKQMILSQDSVADGLSFALASGADGERVTGLSIQGDYAVARRIKASSQALPIEVLGLVGTPIQGWTLDHVQALESLGYGIRIDHTTSGTIIDPYCATAQLDGIKLLARARRVTIFGGLCEDNGQIFVDTGSGAGDGLDGYAGSRGLHIYGLRCRANNGGSGITIKNGDLNRDDEATYGIVRDTELHGVECTDNDFQGLYWTQNDQGDATETPPAWLRVFGGEFSRNTEAGLYLAGDYAKCIGFTANENGEQGVLINSISSNVDIDGHVFANSQTSVGTYDGVSVQGTDCSVRGRVVGTLDGGTTKWHRYNVRVTATAERVVVELEPGPYDTSGDKDHAQSQEVKVDAATSVFVKGWGVGSPRSRGAYGSPGSTFTRLDVEGEDALWIREGGNPEDAFAGWVRAVPYLLSDKTVTTGSNVIAHGLGYLPERISVVPRSAVGDWYATADATNVTINVASGGTVDITVQ